MSDIPAFFVPAATIDQQESVYSDFAQWCRRSVPPLAERIYSITYRHDGNEWTATVGKTLSGTKSRIRRNRGARTEVTMPVSDPAIVLAIFPGEPFMVVTNHKLAGNVGSAWENPFMAGHPSVIIRFTSSPE